MRLDEKLREDINPIELRHNFIKMSIPGIDKAWYNVRLSLIATEEGKHRYIYNAVPSSAGFALIPIMAKLGKKELKEIMFGGKFVKEALAEKGYKIAADRIVGLDLDPAIAERIINA